MGDGPLVILLHGFPGSWYTWRHQLPVLAKAGYRVVAPDMRGYGGTDKPEKIQDYQIDKLSADISGIVDAMGEKSAFLVGHDWGGLVGWAAMLQYPEKFKAYVAMSVPYAGRMQESYVDTLKRAYGDKFYYVLYFQQEGVAEAELDQDPQGFLTRVYTSPDVPKEAPTLTNPRMDAGGLLPRIGVPKKLPDWLSKKDLDYFVSQFQGSGFRGPINYYRNFDRFFELSQELKEVKVAQPVLFIAGAEDPLIGGANEGQLNAMMSGGTKDLRQVKLYPDVGHWVQQQVPDQVNVLMVEFLNGLNKKPR